MNRRQFITATAALGITPQLVTIGEAGEENKQSLGADRSESDSQGDGTSAWLGEWIRNPIRAHFNLGITDAPPEAYAEVNVKDFVEMLYNARVQGISFCVQDPSGWLTYPSTVGQQHPRLKSRDIIGELISACHKHQMKFTGCFTPLEMGVEVTRHPEWRTEFIGDSFPSSPRLWGSLCFNRPGCLEFCATIIREALTRYEIDAVWMNRFWTRECGCGDCQRRYRQETGSELPFNSVPLRERRAVDQTVTPIYAERPEFSDYWRQLQSWTGQWAMELRRTVKEARAQCLITFQYPSCSGHGRLSGAYEVSMAEAADIITSDSSPLGYQHQHSLLVKCVRGFTRNLPFELQIPTAEHNGDETSAKQEGLMQQQFAYALAHGGSVLSVDDLDWSGRVSERKYGRIKQVNAWAGERLRFLGGRMLADVALYASQESHLYCPNAQHWRWSTVRGEDERSPSTSIHHAGNIALTQALIRENISFDVIFRHKLGHLREHKVVYMNNVEVLEDEEVSAIHDFVRNGGGLVVTHRTGLRNGQLQERGNFVFADMMGVDFLEKPDLATSFIVIEQGDRKEGFFAGLDSEQNYFEVHDAQCYVKPRAGAISLGCIARPRRPYMEDGPPRPGNPPVMQLIDPREVRQSGLFLYSPELVTDHPAVVLNRYGEGRVAYCAACPAYDAIDDHHDLMLDLIRWVAGGKLTATVASNAPAPVEIIAMEQPEKKRTVVHAINWQGNWPPVVAHKIEVNMKHFGRRARTAFALEAQSELSLRKDGERIVFTIPTVKVWETVVIDWFER